MISSLILARHVREFGGGGIILHVHCSNQFDIMCGFEHVERRWGHVSIALLEHNVQFGLGCVIGQKMLLR